MVRVHRPEEGIADRETDPTHLEQGTNVTEIDSYALSGDSDSVRWETTVSTVETGQQFAGEFSHSESGQRRWVDPVGVGDDDGWFLARRVARPTCAVAPQYVPFESVFGWVEEITLNDDRVDRSNG